MQSRVESLPAEWTREMSGVADQETPVVRQARDDPPVHPKRREPAHVRGPAPPPDPYLNAGGDVFRGYPLHPLFPVLDTHPASALGPRVPRPPTLHAPHIRRIPPRP